MNFSTNAVSPSFCVKGGELIKSTSPEYLEKALSSVKNSVVESPKKVVIPAATLAAMAGVAMACNKEAPSDTAVDNVHAIKEHTYTASKQEIILPDVIKDNVPPGYDELFGIIDGTKTKVIVCHAYGKYVHKKFEYFDFNNNPVMTEVTTEYPSGEKEKLILYNWGDGPVTAHIVGDNEPDVHVHDDVRAAEFKEIFYQMFPSNE